MAKLIQGKVVVPGRIRLEGNSETRPSPGAMRHAGEQPAASGNLLASDEPLSFWGGYDPHSGEIIDRLHPLSGCCAKGCILALPSSRGSSTTTAVFLETVLNNTAPAAILTLGVVLFFTLASIVADEMLAKPVPILAFEAQPYRQLQNYDYAQVFANGEIHLHKIAQPNRFDHLFDTIE